MNLTKALGYPDKTKLLIIHADDAGLSHAENRATIKALEHGHVNSYSIMVACPWFYEIANFTKKNLQYDHGIHLTLTCEWNQYKFGPVLSPKEVPSLVDDKGYFYKNLKSVVENARVEDVKKELIAQIERALSFGLQPSHIDSHMYSLGAKLEFLELYRELGSAYKLPVFLNKELISQVSGLSLDDIPKVKEPLVDSLFLGQYKDFEKGNLAASYSHALRNLKTGLNLILIHPAYDDPEMKSITIDHPNFGSAWRQTDLDFFISDECKQLLKNPEIKMVTWKEIKDVQYPEK